MGFCWEEMRQQGREWGFGAWWGLEEEEDDESREGRIKDADLNVNSPLWRRVWISAEREWGDKEEDGRESQDNDNDNVDLPLWGVLVSVEREWGDEEKDGRESQTARPHHTKGSSIVISIIRM